MKRKLVIFDLDGTLVNSIEDVVDCFNFVLLKHGFPIHTIDSFSSLVGGDLEQMATRVLPDNCKDNKELIKTIMHEYRNTYFACEMNKTKAYSGVNELLHALKANGFKIAINTNKNQMLTEKVLEKVFSNFMFDVVIGSGVENIRSKPYNDGVRAIQSKVLVENEDTYYVGDTLSDVLTAKNSDIECLYVKWGQGAITDANSYDRVRIFNNCNELEKYLIGD